MTTAAINTLRRLRQQSHKHDASCLASACHRSPPVHAGGGLQLRPMLTSGCADACLFAPHINRRLQAAAARAARVRRGSARAPVQGGVRRPPAGGGEDRGAGRAHGCQPGLLQVPAHAVHLAPPSHVHMRGPVQHMRVPRKRIPLPRLGRTGAVNWPGQQAHPWTSLHVLHCCFQSPSHAPLRALRTKKRPVLLWPAPACAALQQHAGGGPAQPGTLRAVCAAQGPVRVQLRGAGCAGGLRQGRRRGWRAPHRRRLGRLHRLARARGGLSPNRPSGSLVSVINRSHTQQSAV